MRLGFGFGRIRRSNQGFPHLDLGWLEEWYEDRLRGLLKDERPIKSTWAGVDFH